MKMLTIGKVKGEGDFKLPLDDTVTDTIAILARKGSGKTYTAAVIAEQMIRAGVQVVMLDPLNGLWGMRAAPDGKGKGLPVVIFGGSHGDVPLKVGDGPTIAKLLVDQGYSAILCTSLMSTTEQSEFVTGFTEAFYQLKASHTDPCHMIFDEADLFVPQQQVKGRESLYRSMNDLVRRGRMRGIGTTLITQRPAVIAKDVLTQLETLIVLQMKAPLDRKAIRQWIEAHDPEDNTAKVMDTLAALKKGHAWVWCPDRDILKLVNINRRITYDSSSTPKVGKRKRKSVKLGDIDLAAITETLAATIAERDANDPKKLQAEIRKLQQQLSQPAQPVGPVADATDLATLHEVEKVLSELADDFHEKVAVIGQMNTKLTGVYDKLAVQADPKWKPIRDCKPPQGLPRPVHQASNATTATPNAGITQLSKGSIRERIVRVLVQYPDGLERARMAALIVSSVNGNLKNRISELTNSGAIVRDGNHLRITKLGLTFAGDVQPLPTGDALRTAWRAEMGGGVRGAIFAALLDSYPQWLSRDELARLTGTTVNGNFKNRLSEIRGKGLLVSEGSTLRLSEDLF